MNAPHPDERLNNPLLPEGVTDNRFPDPHIKIFVNPDTGREAMYVYVGHDEGFNHVACPNNAGIVWESADHNARRK